jgi:hypothetical protein
LDYGGPGVVNFEREGICTNPLEMSSGAKDSREGMATTTPSSYT